MVKVKKPTDNRKVAIKMDDNAIFQELLNGTPVNYEYLKYTGKVQNETGHKMTFVFKDITWGKIVTEPASIEAGQSGSFEASGRSCAAAGTEGTIIWAIEDGSAVKPLVKLYFCQPYVGTGTESISVDNESYAVNFKVAGTGDSRLAYFIVRKFA